MYAMNDEVGVDLSLQSLMRDDIQNRDPSKQLWSSTWTFCQLVKPLKWNCSKTLLSSLSESAKILRKETYTVQDLNRTLNVDYMA